MPQWLCNQLRRAFLGKNRKQIRLLNDCWFFYHTRLGAKLERSGIPGNRTHEVE
ncbi:MAG: cortex morphogenetic protein CmpA [Paenibacillaceae bacterium]|nr:cortex morphogenetic protein CmpA [Paenibacillaceae bacterium]